ncbi:MAG TPA: hypothetical protein VGJ20_06010 [Xanthobacteraceae bacterium]|jgi:hypothetical protein
MRFAYSALLWTLAIAVSATTASAQSFSSPWKGKGEGFRRDNVGVRYRRPVNVTGPVYRYPGTHCCVAGPAYGWPGEPLGPGVWGDSTTNLRSCGPGACQDNPYY